MKASGSCTCFIVPPHLLEHVALNHEDKEVRAAALATLSRDHSIRAARLHTSHLMKSRPLGTRALMQSFAGEPERTIFDAGHQENPQGAKVLRQEGAAASSDESANQAYDGLGATYKLYWDIYHRNSIDSAGMPLHGVVHFGTGYDNAFWDGKEMVFGDGDGKMFTGFTKSIDVIGHELTHGVTEHSLGLQYLGQSGALNESISDVFGSLVKQYQAGQTADQADWLIGAGILGPAMKGAALRSMKDPGTAFEGDKQPKHMKDYLNTAADNGGVHMNSGIPNHAFYLVAAALGGQAWMKAGWIWYWALHDPRLDSTCDFVSFAGSTVNMCQRFFGAASNEVKAVTDAWKQVGVDPSTLPPGPGEPGGS